MQLVTICFLTLRVEL